MSFSLLCPHCRRPLFREAARYACPAGHSYDIARGGYVNLLSGRPPAVGDNRLMVEARARTLGSGVYAPLRASLAEEAARDGGGGVLLDAGCGEGYYTEALSATADETVGIDISKDALRRAARRLPGATLAVASAYHLPVADGAVLTLTSIFSPLAAEEFSRVLAPGGLLLVAIPGPRHLFSMKRVLYDTPYENEVAAYDSLPGFRHLSAREVGFSFTLDTPGAIADLFTMTPYCYRTPRTGRERLLSLPSLSVEADFRVLAYRKETN